MVYNGIMRRSIPIDFDFNHYWDFSNPARPIWKNVVLGASNKMLGKPVGFTKDHGQFKGRKDIYVGIQGRIYLLARIMYFIYNGVDPAHLDVDHLDGNPLNNSKENLYLKTHADNMKNKKLYRTNRLGLMGIRKMPNGTYMARITANGKRISKTFKTKQEAIACRERWNIEYGYTGRIK